MYWELGVRQSFKHGTVTIAQQGTKLPFDIGGKGTLFYAPNNHVQMESFRGALKAALADCSAHPNRPDSHVLEAISGRGSIYELVRLDEAIRRLDALDAETERTEFTLKEIFSTAVTNLKHRKEKKPDTGAHTEVLRVAAIELLITTRYLEQDAAFYTAFEFLYQRLLNINHRLLMWMDNQVSTEEWMLKVKESSFERINLVRAHVARVRDELGKRR